MIAEQRAKCALDGFHGEGFSDGKETDGSLVVGTAVVVVSGSPSPAASVLGITVARAVGAPRRRPLGRDHRRGDRLLDAGGVPHGWDCNPGVCGAAQGHGCSRSRTGRQGIASKPCPRGRLEGWQEPASRHQTLTPPSSAQTPTLAFQGRNLTPVLAHSIQGRRCPALHVSL